MGPRAGLDGRKISSPPGSVSNSISFKQTDRKLVERKKKEPSELPKLCPNTKQDKFHCKATFSFFTRHFAVFDYTFLNIYNF